MKPLFLFILSLQSFVLLAQNVEPIFKNGEAQIVDEFNDPENWIQHDLWVETEFDSDEDGLLDRMHVDVTRPNATETQGLKLPIIYISSPYWDGTSSNSPGNFWNVQHELGFPPEDHEHPEVIQESKRPIISQSGIKTWVPRGFIVVHSSSVGTGLSDGAVTVGGDNESLAPKAVIDWLCGRAKGYTSLRGDEEVKAYWSTGKVGMMGGSYNGTIPIAAASTGVEGLEAIIPFAPNTSYYHYYRSNGLVRSPGGYLGEDITVLYDYINSGDPEKRAGNNLRIRDTEMKNGMDRVTGNYNDFWAGRDYLNDIEPFKAALLMTHGLNDWNVMPEHSYRIYKAVSEKGVPARIFYHQSGHGGGAPFSMQNKWFSHFLHGIDNGVEKEAKAWIVRENASSDNPTAYEDFPNPEASNVKLYLKKGDLNNGSLSLEKPEAQGLQNLIDDVSFDGSTLAQSPDSKNRLLYLSPELKKDVHISGLAEIEIRLSSSKETANLSVWLVSLPWNNMEGSKITDNIITRGWADPQNYKSIRESEKLEPGKFYSLKFQLQPDDQIIKAGQQIGLMIFSSDREFTLWPNPGTELNIDLDQTTLTLPVVGGYEGF